MSFVPTDPIDPTASLAKPSPFVVFTEHAIPATFDESLSYQQALFALNGYIKNVVVPVINENGKITEQQTKVINELADYVNHYFDDLNVQEQINNKLDAMAESGELAEIINQEIFGELNDRVTANETAISDLVANKVMVKDTDYDSFAEACSDCLDNDYVLYLTTNHNLPYDESELPDIIGNGHTLTSQNTDSSTVAHITINNKTLSDIKFVAGNIGAGVNYCRSGINVNDGVVDRCEFTGYITSIRVVGQNNNIIKNCIIKNTGKGVYVNTAKNVIIDNIRVVNTAEERLALRTYFGEGNRQGEDGVLCEFSENVKIINSYFEQCVERTLYSLESNYVTFSNNTMNYTDGVKFVGANNIARGFVCEGNMLINSFTDAFCQLYQMEMGEVNNNIAINEDGYYIGWFIRAGHSVKRVNITGNYCRRVRRSFLGYQDNFPENLEAPNFDFSFIHIENNVGEWMGMISNLPYGAIDYQQNETETEHTGGQVTIKNNTWHAVNYRKDSTFANEDSNYVFDTAIRLKNIDFLIIENNDIRGVRDSEYKILPFDLENCTNVTVNETYYTHRGFNNLKFTKYAGILSSHIKILANLSTRNEMLDLLYTGRGAWTGTYESELVNQAMYLYFSDSWNINLDILNVDEISKVYTINGTRYTSGSRTSTSSSVVTDNMIYIYHDSTQPQFIVRCPTVRNLSINGTVSFYPN